MRKTRRVVKYVKDDSSSSSDDDLPLKRSTAKVIKKPNNSSSSESDIETYLQRPEDLDLNSTFFQPSKAPNTSFADIEKDIFAGINKLSDSDESDEEVDKLESNPEEKVSNKKRKLSKQVKKNEAGIPKLNFQALHDYTKKIEEAKEHVEKYLARKQSNEIGPDINTLLSVGEKDSSATSLQLSTLHSSDFDSASESEKEDWEVVKNTDITKEHEIPKEGLEITMQLPDVIRKKKDVDLLAALKRRLNRIKKENQVYVHKVHMLCWIAHGNYVNETLNKENLLGMALSLLPSQHCYPSDRTDLKYLEQILNWYRKTIKNVEKVTPKSIELEKKLHLQMGKKEANNKKMFVYIFICILRSLGIQCRLVLSLQVEPLRPPASELNSLSTKKTPSVKESEKTGLDNGGISTTEKSIEKNVHALNKKSTEKRSSESKNNDLNLKDIKKSPEIQKLSKHIVIDSKTKSVRPNEASASTTTKENKDKHVSLSKLKKFQSKATLKRQKDPVISKKINDLNQIVANLEKLESHSSKSEPKKELIVSLVKDEKFVRKSTRMKDVALNKEKDTIDSKNEYKSANLRSSINNIHKHKLLHDSETESTDKVPKKVKKLKVASLHESKELENNNIKEINVTKQKITSTKKNLKKKDTLTVEKNKRQRSISPKDKIGSANIVDVHQGESESNQLTVVTTKRSRRKGPMEVNTKPDTVEVKVPFKPLTKKKGVHGEKKFTQLDGFNESSSDDNCTIYEFDDSRIDSDFSFMFQLPQLDGANDEKASTSQTKKIDLKKLKDTQLNECPKKHPRRLKIKPIYKDSNSDDEFKTRSPFSPKNSTILQKKESPSKKVTKHCGSPSKSADMNRSKFFGSTKKKLDVRKDIVSLVKSRIQAQKYTDRAKNQRKSKISIEDSDSDYAPEALMKKKHDDSSDDEFIKKIKVKRRVMPKKEIDRRVFSSDDEKTSKADGKKKQGTDIWAEVYLESEEKWISVDIIKGQVHCIKELYSRATHPISYILSWDNNNNVKDISKRYCPNWNTVTRKLRAESKWIEESLKPFKGRQSARDKEEDEDLARQQLEQPLPSAISEYKNHPLYVLQRHLLKFQALYPPEPPILGFVRKEPVYSRDCVFTLHSREIWVKHAKVVKPGEQPYKIVKARPKYDRLTKTMITDKPLEIFGEWQIDDYDPPTAENGVVPRNAYGNVELFKACMLPKKTVHLQLPGLNKVARKLNIDCVPAVVGFDFHSGSTHPTFDGYVVCEEFSEVIVAAWYLEQEEAEKREIEKVEKRVYGNWRRLIKGLLIKERLKRRYDFGETSGKSDKKEKKKSKFLLNKRKICSDNESDSN